jgi:predicted NAD/FAD-binding protein
MKIAIIGTGISGLSAGYLLHTHHDITVYEKDSRIGGHSRTIEINDGTKNIALDTGFIVFNDRNYPHLISLFKHLDVETQKSDMSFGASINNGFLEYGSKGMFAQKRNWLRPKFWGMIWDILYFNRKAPQYLNRADNITLEDCLKELNVGVWFRKYYLQAMGAAIWSCSVETILKFPARTFIQFFHNHGLLTINNHPQWYTVTGGSRNYIKKLIYGFQDRIKTNCGAASVTRTQNGIIVTDTTGKQTHYDHVIFACHADQALNILKDANEQETEILSAFTYQKNQVVVHSDVNFMPQKKSAWASWVYLSEKTIDQQPSVSLSYWMNNLQNLPTAKQIFVTLNPGKMPAPNTIYDQHSFEHPVFTRAAIRAQSDIQSIQNTNHVSYCGAHLRYGFHEDGILSAVKVANTLGVQAPWQ